MADAGLQRRNMVESQVRPSDVTDRRITGAMQDIARELFVPEPLRALAYMDEDLPFAGGRALAAPRSFARLIQLADIDAGNRVLDCGALTGYSSAVLARLGREVVALESNGKFAAEARQRLADLTVSNVTVVVGALEAGHPAGAPYDVIIIEGAVERIPEALTAQMAPGGRLVTIEVLGGVGRALVVTKTAQGNLARRVAFEASAPLLAGFEKPKTFVF